MFGIVSAIGGALSAAGSVFCSGISSICSAIGGALFGGAGGIGELAAAIVGPVIVSPHIAVILGAIQAVAMIVTAMAEIMGIKEKDETPQELGMKAEQAEKKPGDFDSTEKYIEYLRKEVEIDQKKVESLTEEDKAKYGAIGTALYIKAIEERYDIKAPGDFWRTMADVGIKGEEVKTYVETFKENGIDNMADMSDYMKGKAPGSGAAPEKISDSMVDALKKIYPGISEDEAYDKLTELSL